LVRVRVRVRVKVRVRVRVEEPPQRAVVDADGRAAAAAHLELLDAKHAPG